jgi:hypothetical protein
MSEIYQDIPTYDNGNWTTTSFESREEFSNFIFGVFKEPGEYNFNETTNKVFISESVKFKKDGVYTTAPFKSKDYITYWDDQKAKCRKGIIVKDKDNTWFVAREYYPSLIKRYNSLALLKLEMLSIIWLYMSYWQNLIINTQLS